MGDIEDVIERGVRRVGPSVDTLSASIHSIIENSKTLQTASRSLASATWDKDAYATIIHEELLTADMFGQMQAQDESALFDVSFTKLLFREAVSFFLGKKVMTKRAFDKLSDDYKRKSFTVANLQKKYVIEKVKDRIDRAIKKGETKASFVKRINREFDKLGITRLKKHHLETVFDTNVIGSYQHGRWTQQRRVVDDFPYWQYKTANDGAVRPSHEAMHNKVYHCDDAVWEAWYPPSGFRCRCYVKPLTDKAGSRLAEDDQPAVKPDKGFASSPKDWLK